MLDFSGGGARHFIIADESHRAWPFVTGNAVAAPLDDLGFAWHHAVAGHDHRMYALTPRRIVEAYDRHIFDLLVRAEQRFHFRWIDILAAGNDHVALAIAE